MAASMGLSADVGPIDLSRIDQPVSPLTLARLDRAVRNEVRAAQDAASKVLHDNLNAMHALATVLLDRESISGDDVRAVVTTYATSTQVSD